MAPSRSLSCTYFVLHFDAYRSFVLEPFCMSLLTGGQHQLWASHHFSAVTYCHVPSTRCLSALVAGISCPAAYQQYASVCSYEPSDIFLLLIMDICSMCCCCLWYQHASFSGMSYVKICSPQSIFLALLPLDCRLETGASTGSLVPPCILLLLFLVLACRTLGTSLIHVAGTLAVITLETAVSTCSFPGTTTFRFYFWYWSTKCLVPVFKETLLALVGFR